MTLSDKTIDKTIDKIRARERISPQEALALFKTCDLLTLGSLANEIRCRRHPENRVTFVVDRNINYTNICVSGCRFCAFYAVPGGEGGYVLTHEVLGQKIQETLDLGGTQILLQGGMNPDLELDFYTDMLEFITGHYDIHVHGFSPPEIHFLAEKSGLSVTKTLTILKAAGLSSIPGGGAEILCDDIRSRVSPNKCGADAWIDVMRKAHRLGMRSSATMMFGHLETQDHIVEHLDRIRTLQDETSGFTAFIPWTFQPGNTRIDVTKKTSAEYLKVLALSRIFLDNVDNVQASWVTQGDKIAQVALFFGANDMGSTMIEENVVASAGVDFMLPESALRRLIETAGFIPRQRDCYYTLL
jgi:cyclic dehypoxanthinyl futalosine synthase